MELNLQENELICTFDFGIQDGSLISNSDYIWCINTKDNSLLIKNVVDKNEASLPYHQFGISSNEKFSVITAKDFEYNQQRYLVISLEISLPIKKNILAIFKLSVSKIICAFQIPFKATNLEILVKNRHFIDNTKNPSFFGNFEVTCLAGCEGGSVQIFDITPSNDLLSLSSNETNSSSVYWYKGPDFTDYDDLRQEKQIANHQSKIFGIYLNEQAFTETHFKYMMPNDNVTASLPIDLVKITALKYEKQIDSILIGFNFGCFQIWNMKTLNIESSSEYGENTKPIIGFSLLQPQNDPKKCLYLMVAHSRSVSNEKNKTKHIKKAKKESKELEESDCENRVETEDEDETVDDFEIDEEDDEIDSSFILLYQLIFERCSNIFLSQHEFYFLYEEMNNCSVVFEHEFSAETLKCVKTNCSNAFEQYQVYEESESDLYKKEHLANSKIISIQTLNILNNRLQLDLTCLIWALVDKNKSTTEFFFSIFNLNNWYIQCMPEKMKQLFDNGNKIRENLYFENYNLSINNDIDEIKFVSVIDSKIKKAKKRNNLSIGNSLRKLLIKDYETKEDDDEDYELNSNDESHLSMHFDLLVLSPFSLIKLSIKPIEHQIQQYISLQEDLIYRPDKVYYLLSRYNLISHNNNPKLYILIFNYLLETSQIYPILKSLWKLNIEDTSVISDYSLKIVLDWSWSKVVNVKTEINKLYELLQIQLKNYLNLCSYTNDMIDRNNLAEFLQRENNLLDNLIQIYRQFLKLDTTHQGYSELKKKLCVIESLKCFIEHLILFNKFGLLVPSSLNDIQEQQQTNNENNTLNKSYLNEMQINFQIIENRWNKRRQEQQADKPNNDLDKHKYPFTYLIDCLIEECKPFANTSKFFLKNNSSKLKQVKFVDENINQQPELITSNSSNTYPPKSITELLEICLECNLSTKIKQILILYALCDLMHTELNANVQNHILKLINAYCSSTFTLMTTSLDSALSVPWSSSTTSIVSLSTETEDPNNSSCLFDMVNGLYLIDSHYIERAFKYLRATDLNYLEFYEKYFILYNSANLSEYKIAAQYLWLFQKLNAASISASSETNVKKVSSKIVSNEMESDLNLFKFFTEKSNNNLNDLNDLSDKLKHEQKMHFRLILTIYLANSLINEAFDLIKPHIKHIRASISNNDTTNIKLSKELLIHFFVESERFKLWKQISRLSSLDNDFLLLLINYLEAKQDSTSICRVIDLHINNKNFKRAVELFDKNHKLITSEFSYLNSYMELAKECPEDYSFNTLNLVSNIITLNDIKEVLNFEYKFTIPLKELCKDSKRCLNLLSLNEDLDYINLLKFPQINQSTQSQSLQTPRKKSTKIGQEITNTIHTTNETPCKSILTSAVKKRKASTPHPGHVRIIDHIDSPINQESNTTTNKFISASETKNRVLTSSLKISRNLTQSVSKSVKFKTTRITREISNENIYDREELEQDLIEETEKSQIDLVSTNQNDGRKKLEFLDDESDEKLESNLSKEQSKIIEKQDESMEEEKMEQSIHEEDEKKVVLNKSSEVQDLTNNFDITEEQTEHSISEKKSLFSTDDIKIDIPILTNTDEIRKSIFEKVINSAHKSFKEQSPNKSLNRSDGESVRLFLSDDDDEEIEQDIQIKKTESESESEPVKRLKIDEKEELENKSEIKAEAHLLKCSTEKEFETPIKSNNQFDLTTTCLSPIETETQQEEENQAQVEKEFELETEKQVEFTTSASDSVVETCQPVYEEITNPVLNQEFVSESMQKVVDDNEETILDKLNCPKTTRISELDLSEDHRAINTLVVKEKEENNDFKANCTENTLQEFDSQNCIQHNQDIEMDDKCEDLEKQQALTISEENDKKDLIEYRQNIEIDEKNDNLECMQDLQPTDKVSIEKKDLIEYRQNIEIDEKDDNLECMQDLQPTDKVSIEKIHDIEMTDKYEILEDQKNKQVELQNEQEYELTYVQNSDCQTSMISSVITGQDDDVQMEEDYVEPKEKQTNEADKLETLNSSTKTLEENDNENEITCKKSPKPSENHDDSNELNMSSVSNQSQKLSQNTNDLDKDDDKLILPDDNPSRLVRTNSELSLFSQISSVSEHYEKIQKEKEEASKNDQDKTKRAIKRRAPVSKISEPFTRHLDDNDLTTNKLTKTNILRRKSDLSSLTTNIKSSLSRSQSDVAKLKAKIPETLGSNEQESRVTRGKLKTLLEQPSTLIQKTTKLRSNRTNSKKSEQILEQVEENEESNQEEESNTKISINNLKKHNAQMEKSIETNDEKDAKISKTISKTTRSKARSPSPSASSIISTTSILSVESASTITSTKPRGRPKSVKKVEDTSELNDKTLKQDDDYEPSEKLSPTNSIVSVSSIASITSTASSVRPTRRSTRKTKEQLDAEKSELEKSPSKLSANKSYNLRKKGKDEQESNNEEAESTKQVKKTTRAKSFRTSAIGTKTDDMVNEIEKPKSSATVMRTRSLRSSTDIKTNNLELSENVKSSLNKITESKEEKKQSGNQKGFKF